MPRNILPRNVHEAAVARAVQRALSLGDLTPAYRAARGAGCDAMTGHCFAATNAFWHLMGGNEGPYRPKQVRVAGVSHWFLIDTRSDTVVDLTASQFGKTRVPYEEGRRVGMRARPGGDSEPTERAKRIIERVLG
jgi:hypothetical protein